MSRKDINQWLIGETLEAYAAANEDNSDDSSTDSEWTFLSVIDEDETLEYDDSSNSGFSDKSS
jgi:hypothetical protein